MIEGKVSSKKRECKKYFSARILLDIDKFISYGVK
jgi:hypothetical protein